MAYPIKHAADQMQIQAGTFRRNVTADGISYSFTLVGTKASFDTYSASILVRGVNVFTYVPSWGVPTGYYIDEISDSVTLAGVTDGESAVSVNVVCRSAQNMGDGIVSASIPDVYTIQWQQMDKPLAAHSVRYTTLKEFVGTTKKTVWGYIQDWVNASSAAEQEGVYNAAIAGMSGFQRDDFEDYCVMVTRGVEALEVFLPVLTRTQVTNTIPTATNTPGQIATPPAGFGAMTPSGYTWRRMPDEVTRSGRAGAYNLTSRWLGDPAWDPRLYGTTGQQDGTDAGGEFQTLG